MKLVVASLDLFWMPPVHAALAEEGDAFFCSTWSPRKAWPNPGLPRKNNVLLHYALAVYKRFPVLQHRNLVYLPLCELFDLWLRGFVSRETGLLWFLSGCGLWSMRKAHRFGMPVVVDSGSTHTDWQHQVVWEEYQRNGLRHPLFPEAYRARVRQEFIEADFIQVPSEFVKRTYLEHGIPETKILKAPYGADVDRFTARTREDMGPVFRVICPSGVNIRKGARVLAEAWRRLAWKPSEAELHWVGWPDHPQVRHLFKEPLQGVVWHGWMTHEELCDLYRSCDVFVLPSFEEGLARVLIEAAASGLPLIVTPNTGAEDFFTPGSPEGWMIDAGSVDALCDALQAARADREAAFQLGQRAAARAREGFTWEDYKRRVRGNLGVVLGEEWRVTSIG